ncbi:MAG: glycosyltransferase [bacterium]
MKRLLIVTSDRSGKFDEKTSAEAHFKVAPYSLGALRLNLERLGWTTCYAPLSLSSNPFRLARFIDGFKPDIIYTYGSTVALHPLFCRAVLCRHKVFKVIHGWDDVYGEIWADVFGKVPGLFMVWMEKRIIRNSDGVVTLSTFNQQRARPWGVECHYIPNGADVPQVDPEACRIKLTGKMNLVYTGDQAKWKRTAEICEAMRHVPKEIKLYLTGEHYDYLDEYASDNCIFLGFVSKSDQWGVMSQADVLVVTADQDCNAKLQEYLRFRKPILGYDGRMNLFFKNGRNALLTRDYAAAIQRLAADPELCRALAQNAEKDLRVFTWFEIAQQFDAYFGQMLGLHQKEKVVLFDHACHASTQSARFFYDLLSPHFDITVHVYEHFYRYQCPQAEVNRHDYALYFEFLPGRLKLFYPNTRSLFVPMYDNEWGSKWQWRRIAMTGMPVISFCARVTRFARAQGVRSVLDVRYFPDPGGYKDMEGDPRVLLLWERGQITFETVKALFQPHDFKKIILLRHPEERLTYAALSDQDIRNYHVEVIHTAFMPREQFIEVLRPAGAVLAPRMKEGIGMAFLEAMAMRKCVIAHRDATMDEYIEPGVNGLLFDAEAPRKLSISDVIRIHSTLPDPVTHYNRWLADKDKIVPFIQSTPLASLSLAQAFAFYLCYPLAVFEFVRFRFFRKRRKAKPEKQKGERA